LRTKDGPVNPVQLLSRLVARQSLASDETRALFDALMEDRLEPALTAALLAALASKGETVDEVVGAARAMRARVLPVGTPPGVPVIDTCGTGGDGKPVFNVSTAVAIVAAAAGATVAKHGNRSNARPSGSAEVVGALGVNLEADTPILEACLRDCRIAFLYAARLHPAMKHAAPIRRTLGIRTIFNLLGPLTNPAGVRRQMLGVPRPDLVPAMLTALRRLGAERALVVHGRDGLCDVSVAEPTLIGRWDGVAEQLEEVDCSVIGIRPGRLEGLYVTSPQHSAAVIREALAGQGGLARDMIVLNAAGALWVAGLAVDWADGARQAREAIASGAAAGTLAAWVRRSWSGGEGRAVAPGAE
jgi:anthranilate phosphoribosyltransferase